MRPVMVIIVNAISININKEFTNRLFMAVCNKFTMENNKYDT